MIPSKSHSQHTTFSLAKDNITIHAISGSEISPTVSPPCGGGVESPVPRRLPSGVSLHDCFLALQACGALTLSSISPMLMSPMTSPISQFRTRRILVCVPLLPASCGGYVSLPCCPFILLQPLLLNSHLSHCFIFGGRILVADFGRAPPLLRVHPHTPPNERFLSLPPDKPLSLNLPSSRCPASYGQT